MKSVKLELPARLHKQLKLWLIECEQSQSDMFCYLVDHLPPAPKFEPRSDLLNYLSVYQNQTFLRKNYSKDDIRMLELIARGVIKPNADEQKLIDKLLKP